MRLLLVGFIIKNGKYLDMKFNEFYLTEENVYRIFCDMDSVLTDFVGQYSKYANMTPEESYLLYKTDVSKFWEPVNNSGVEFWSEMPWIEDGRELWEYVSKYSPTILTAPSRGDDCPKGKKIWVKRELGDIPIIIDRDKYKYSRENYILVDDTEEKIDKWIEAGGIGILHTSAKDTISKLKDIFGEKNEKDIN